MQFPSGNSAHSRRQLGNLAAATAAAVVLVLLLIASAEQKQITTIA
jgi:hypothetical protein